MAQALLEEFRAYLADHDRAPLTVTGYAADVQLFARWFEQTNSESFTPAAVTPSDIRGYRQYLLTEKRQKANTINRKLAALTTFMAWAKTSGHIEHDPTIKVRFVEESPRGPKSLDKQQQFALQRAIEKDVQYSQAQYPKRWLSRWRDASLVLVLWHTGLRVSEVIAMRRSDVQLSERKGQVTVRGKGTKQRTVPLNAEARRALQDWFEVRPETETTAIWISPDTGDELTVRSVQRVLQRYGRAAHIDDLTPHVLRHSFGKALIDAQVSIEKVAALLGHSNLNTTRIYITPSDQDLETAVKKIEVR